MFETAANDCNLLAMLRTGEMYLNRAVSINPGGKAVRRDLTRAGVYLEALLGNGALKDAKDEEDLNHGIKVLALVHHGDYIFFKNGYKCNEEAEKKFRKAANMGDAGGQYKLGWLYKQLHYNVKTKKHDSLVRCVRAWHKAVRMKSGQAAADLGAFCENLDN